MPLGRVIHRGGNQVDQVEQLARGRAIVAQVDLAGVDSAVADEARQIEGQNSSLI